MVVLHRKEGITVFYRCVTWTAQKVCSISSWQLTGYSPADLLRTSWYLSGIPSQCLNKALPKTQLMQWKPGWQAPTKQPLTSASVLPSKNSLYNLGESIFHLSRAGQYFPPQGRHEALGEPGTSVCSPCVSVPALGSLLLPPSTAQLHTDQHPTSRNATQDTDLMPSLPLPLSLAFHKRGW